MGILQKQDDLLKAVHKKIPNAKDARVVVKQIFEYMRVIIENDRDFTLNKVEKLINEDIIYDTSYSDNFYKSNIAITMSKINELCYEYGVDELFPNITPQSRPADYRHYIEQLYIEHAERSKAEHAEYDRRKKLN